MPLAINIPKIVVMGLINCAAKGNTRFALNGVNVEIDAGRVILTSSDTHRLLCYSPVTDPDAESILAEYVKAGKDAIKAEFNDPAMRQEDEKKCNDRILATFDAIEKAPFSFILSIPAFKARCVKIPRSDNMLFNLDAIRDDEKIKGQFLRYRDIFPQAGNPLGVKMLFSGDKNDERTIIGIENGSTWNIDYLSDAAKIVRYIGANGLAQADKDSLGIAEIGTRPWQLAQTDQPTTSDYFCAVLVMPTR